MGSGEIAGDDSRSCDHLRAAFSIELHPANECAILDAGPRGEDVSQDIVCHDGHCEEGCHCRSAVTLPDTGDKQLLSGTVQDRCICPVFRSHDCIASIERFEAGTLEVELRAPDRDELEAIVGELRATGATVRLQYISALAGRSGEQHLEVHASEITDKQREAVRVAVEEGYYERPRQANLGELADRLGISKSAVSQRLSAVESNLITALFERETEH